jgi:hypothetical protein
MDHIESQRLFELAQKSVVVDQPEWNHIKNCEDCGLAFLQLRDILERCYSYEAQPSTVP